MVKAIVTNIISSLIYDAGKKEAKKRCSNEQENDLRNALNEYIEKQRRLNEKDGDMLIANIPFPKQNGQLYQEVLSLRADEDALVETWINRCEPELCDRLRPICRDCIRIIIKHIKDWPVFTADLALLTNDTITKIHNDTKKTSILVEKLKPEENHVQAPIIIKNRISEYKHKWEDALFLNDPSKVRGVKCVCPKDIYISNRYLFNDESKPSDDKKYPLAKELATRGGHLVLGDPGIGKSTLISWYLNTSCDPRAMLVYRLTDFELTGTEDQPGDYLLKRMGLQLNQLTNTVLFLDGLDECGLTPENRVRFLRELYNNWLFLSDRNISWIVTCRINYISEEQFHSLKISRVTLLPLEKDQIELFLQEYEAAIGRPIPAEKRAAVLSEKNTGKLGSPFGIPLILYMAIASDIVVAENSSLVDVYDKIFPALYQRSTSYETYDQQLVFLHHTEIHQMSRDIALWILLHNSKTASIPEEAYKEIENAFGGGIAAEHVHQIGSYFRAMHHTEGNKELCFIHRTMYEYFVADGFVHRAIHSKTAEELSGIISWYWYTGQMEETIQQYVKEKLRQHKDALNFALWEAAGQSILKKGVHRCWQEISDKTASIGEYKVANCLLPSCGNSLEEDRQSENTAFWNLCHLLLWVKNARGIKDYIFKQKGYGKSLSLAIRHCSADYYPIYCPAFNLSYASLSRAVLSHATMTCADLSKAHLSYVDFTGADLRRAILTGANIDNANLTGALLSKEHIKMLGYNKLSNCYFEKIKIGSSFSDCIEYPRKQFFTTFFSKQPNRGKRK